MEFRPLVIIKKMIELIILDMYGTIINRAHNMVPRNGFLDFMKLHEDKKIVLSTDDKSVDRVKKHLEGLGIISRLDSIYTYDNMIKIPGYYGPRKNLRQTCDDLDVAPVNAVFISDGDKDMQDAKRDGVKFIHVPYYERSIEPFSFDMIDLTKQLPEYLDLRNANPIHSNMGL